MKKLALILNIRKEKTVISCSTVLVLMLNRRNKKKRIKDKKRSTVDQEAGKQKVIGRKRRHQRN